MLYLLKLRNCLGGEEFFSRRVRKRSQLHYDAVALTHTHSADRLQTGGFSASVDSCLVPRPHFSHSRQYAMPCCLAASLNGLSKSIRFTIVPNWHTDVPLQWGHSTTCRPLTVVTSMCPPPSFAQITARFLFSLGQRAYGRGVSAAAITRYRFPVGGTHKSLLSCFLLKTE